MVNQVIFAVVLSNASTMTVNTTVNTKALVLLKLLTLPTKLNVQISMNVKNLRVTKMQLAITLWDHSLVTVTSVFKLIQLVNT